MFTNLLKKTYLQVEILSYYHYLRLSTVKSVYHGNAYHNAATTTDIRSTKRSRHSPPPAAEARPHTDSVGNISSTETKPRASHSDTANPKSDGCILWSLTATRDFLLAVLIITVAVFSSPTIIVNGQSNSTIIVKWPVLLSLYYILHLDLYQSSALVKIILQSPF